MNSRRLRRKAPLITGIIGAGALAIAGCSTSSSSNAAQGYAPKMTAAFTKATGIRPT
ncbi:MAG TPA: hypothetical protein VG253_26200 [Streptosporangiaceae bacterium]|nr:hypothetical protein [Streptosporangiaceae bacterium]